MFASWDWRTQVKLNEYFYLVTIYFSFHYVNATFNGVIVKLSIEETVVRGSNPTPWTFLVPVIVLLVTWYFLCHIGYCRAWTQNFNSIQVVKFLKIFILIFYQKNITHLLFRQLVTCKMKYGWLVDFSLRRSINCLHTYNTVIVTLSIYNKI